METRRALEMLVRRTAAYPSSSSLTPYLIPSLFSQRTWSSHQQSYRRTLSGSASARNPPASNATAAATKDVAEDNKQAAQNVQTDNATSGTAGRRDGPATQSEQQRKLYELLGDGHSQQQGPPSTAQSLSSTPSNNASSDESPYSRSGEIPASLRGGSTAKKWQTLDTLLRSAVQLKRPFGGPKVDISRMQFPSNLSAGNSSSGSADIGSARGASGSSELWNYMELFPTRSAMPPNTTALEEEMAAPRFKSGPSLGRTVDVEVRRGVDLARAFRSVDMQLRQNNVRADVRQQRFHERPGLKRKRLASQRWRANFQVMMRRTVRRVKELNRQGW